MQIKLLKDIVADIAGNPAVEIVDLLAEKKDVNEFLIAKKLKLTINQTRNILYKLSDAGLVSFIRKKDKRKGWYIYFWTLNSLKSLELLENKFLEEIALLKKQLENKKTKRFYFCETCNVEVGEETALLNEFTCRECGQIYTLAVNDKIIHELESKINKLKKALEIIVEEKGKALNKQDKKRSRVRKKEEREEKKEKEKKRKKRMRERAALKKKENPADKKVKKKAKSGKAKKKTKKKPKRKK